MKLLMRRPEIEDFVDIAAPANRFDFSCLAPCPRSGLFIQGCCNMPHGGVTSRRDDVMA